MDTLIQTVLSPTATAELPFAEALRLLRLMENARAYPSVVEAMLADPKFCNQNWSVVLPRSRELYRLRVQVREFLDKWEPTL